MGGVAILIGDVGRLLWSHLDRAGHRRRQGPTASGLLLLVPDHRHSACVGFLDDFIKIRKQRNLGLNKTAKLVGQTSSRVTFGILALQFRNGDG